MYGKDSKGIKKTYNTSCKNINFIVLQNKTIADAKLFNILNKHT